MNTHKNNLSPKSTEKQDNSACMDRKKIFLYKKEEY